MVAATLALGIFTLGIPAYYHQLCTLSAPDITDPDALRAGLTAIGLSTRAYAMLVVSFESLLSLGFVAIAVFLAARKSKDGLVLFVSLALILFGTTFPEIDDAVVVSHPGLAWLPALLNLAGFVALFTCFYVFPDGRFVPRWTWPLPALWVVEEIGHIAEDHWSVLELPNMILFLGLIGTCVYSQIHRYRKVSGPVQRQQTKWVVFGFTVAVVGFLVYGFSSQFVQAGAEAVLHEFIVGAVMTAGFLSVPLAICIAILRYRLWDIDVVTNRTLVYGTLTAGVVGVYSLVVGYLGLLFQARDNLAFSVIAAGAVAILFQPARERVQRLVNRLMHGERDEPYAVLARLGQRLEATMAPDAILPTIVETIAQALKLPYVAIDLWHEDQIVAAVAHGTPGNGTTSLPLVYQSVPVGYLRLSPRAPGEPFSQADQRLLAGIAH